ncbi:hypothetical protein EV360DRAFT_96915 [Lentinula raphanica]|nr:hypothetical protein EV360DRAFT_96915 [Lentinula raphanica]
MPTDNSTASLLDAFRLHYDQFYCLLVSVYNEETDPFLLRLLGEDLEEFARLVNQHSHIFSSEEFRTLCTGHTGHRGRPRTEISTGFLHWAYGHRTVSGIARFLGVSRDTVRRRLLEHGIATPGNNPFPSSGNSDGDEILDIQIEEPVSLPEAIVAGDNRTSSASSPSSATRPSSISDQQLDSLLSHLRIYYSRAGIRILDGLLRRSGHIVPYNRIQQSLLRIDPIHRVFDRIRIRRRGYSVPGPNSLWHHDGHHRKSVHNVRIERLWVDVSHYISQTWHELFTILELRHGLDVLNTNHIWLLQHLFLPTINEQLALWAEGWNNHRISQRNGPSRSPEDMFGFDMITNGLRGGSLDEVAMTHEELEVFGVDWEGLRDDALLSLLRRNYSHEGSGSWLGQRGPPPELNRVTLRTFRREPQEGHIIHLWTISAKNGIKTWRVGSKYHTILLTTMNGTP